MCDGIGNEKWRTTIIMYLGLLQLLLCIVGYAYFVRSFVLATLVTPTLPCSSKIGKCLLLT